MLFESKRLQRLSGVLNESAEVEKADDANQEELKEFDLGSMLSGGKKVGEIAMALFEALKKPENKALRDSIRKIIPGDYQEAFDKLVPVAGDEKKAGVEAAEKTETVEESAIRNQVRKEIRSLWSSGQIFNKSDSSSGSVTLGFPGIGFRK